jgi:hypothetical protein
MLRKAEQEYNGGEKTEGTHQDQCAIDKMVHYLTTGCGVGDINIGSVHKVYGFHGGYLLDLL